MKIFILKKSVGALRDVGKTECETSASTVREFITERITANYDCAVGMSLDECIENALFGFENSAFYIVNTTQDVRYRALDEALCLSGGDEIALIKLKYVRGVVF